MFTWLSETGKSRLHRSLLQSGMIVHFDKAQSCDALPLTEAQRITCCYICATPSNIFKSGICDAYSKLSMATNVYC